MNDLKGQQIGFRSLVESIDTATPTGQFFFQVTGAFAELERNLIRERTLAGLTAARARGRRGGRPKALDKVNLSMALEIYRAKNVSVGSICKRFEVSKRTLYRYLAETKVNSVG